MQTGSQKNAENKLVTPLEYNGGDCDTFKKIIMMCFGQTIDQVGVNFDLRRRRGRDTMFQPLNDHIYHQYTTINIVYTCIL